MRLSVSVPRRALRSLAILLATVLSLSVLMAVAPTSTATAAEPRLPSTIEDGGFIISDTEYFNGGSMTVAERPEGGSTVRWSAEIEFVDDQAAAMMIPMLRDGFGAAFENLARTIDR